MVKKILLVACASGLVIGCSEKSENKHEASAGVSIFAVAASNDTDELAQLIKSKVDLNQKDADGNTALHIATLNGAKDVATKLIQSGVEIDSLNAKGETPLIVATRAGQTEMIRALLRLNASPDLKDEQGYRAITIAAESGNPEVVEALALYSRQYLDDALFVAALKGHSEMINPLTNYGASVYSRLDGDGRTPLMLAAQNGHQESVRILMENGANRYSTDEQGMTAAQLAQVAGHQNIAEYLGEVPSVEEFSIVDFDEEIVAKTVTKVVEIEQAVATAEAISAGDPIPNMPPEVDVFSLDSRQIASVPAKPLEDQIQIKAYREESLPVKIKGVDNKKVSVRYLYGENKTVDVFPGQKIPETTLEVVSAQQKRDHSKVTANGEPADVSLVKVRDTNSGEIKEVTAGLDVGRTQPFAVLQEADSGLFLVAKRGDLFKDKEGTSYEILEVRPTQLVIMNVDTGVVETLKK